MSSGRLIPAAAQRRSDSCEAVNGLEASKSRTLRRCFSASSRVAAHLCSGAGRACLSDADIDVAIAVKSRSADAAFVKFSIIVQRCNVRQAQWFAHIFFTRDKVSEKYATPRGRMSKNIAFML